MNTTEIQKFKKVFLKKVEIAFDEALAECGLAEESSNIAVILNFIDEVCEKAQDSEIKSSQLYAKYVEWAQENNKKIITHQKFSRNLSSTVGQGINYRKKADGGYFTGIKFK